jgi:beta-glucosidase
MGNALADVLWGDVNPSGRLPLTFPASDAQTPLRTPAQYPGVDGVVSYSERLQVGYRWWDASSSAPLFPFGHGLSYTAFTYAELVVDATRAAPNVSVSFSVRNAGARAGREVPQLYVGFPDGAGEPPSQLRGFAALPLAPGEAATVALTLSPRDLSVWDAQAHAWARARGQFRVAVGASSRDVRLEATFQVDDEARAGAEA